MPSTLRRTYPFVLAVLAACGARASAKPDRIKIDYPVKTVAVTETELELGTEYNYYGETITRNGSGRVRYSNNYFQEYLMGRIEGYAYHPRFMTYSVELKPGLSQQSLHYSSPTDSRSSSSEDELLGYDVRLDFFRESPVSGTVTASRDERTLMGLYLDRYLVRTEAQAGTVRWITRDLQMDLTGTHSHTEDFGFRSYGETDQNSLEYNLHHQLGERIHTDVQYRWQSYDRDYVARSDDRTTRRDTSIDTQDFSVVNRIDFDSLRRSYLRSTFRYHERDNDQDLKTYFFEERFQHKFSRDLRGYVTGSYRRYESAQDTDTYHGETGLDGNIYKSITWHLDVHGTRTEYETLDENRYGATGRVNYHKLTKLGVLSAGYGRTIDRVERLGISGTRDVYDESVRIYSSSTSYLDNSDIVESTIVVTDSTDTTTYIEGFDYEIRKDGGRVGIRLVPGGSLNEGDTVLVDYQVKTSGDLKYFSDDEDMSIRHDFSRGIPGLALYANRHVLRAHDVKSEVPADIYEYSDDTFGLQQKWRQFTFTDEYEIYDDDTGGYNQWRNQLGGNHAVNSHLRAGWNVGYTMTDYNTNTGSSTDRESRYAFGGVHLDGIFARTGYWRLEAQAQRETGRTDRTIAGIIGRIGYTWRRLTFEGGARYEQYDVESSEQDRVQVFLSMKFKLSRRYHPEAKK